MRPPAGVRDAGPAGAFHHVASPVEAARAVDPDRRGPWFWLAIALICAAAGAFYGLITRDGVPIVGAVYGLFAGMAVMIYERGVILRALRRRLRRLPLVPGVLCTEATYLGLIILAKLPAGTLVWAMGRGGGQTLGQAVAPALATLLYALACAGLVITLSRMRDLIGAEVFRNILLGRYHQPVEEERIFLFIDLIGSTAYAQAHGDLKAQAFLGAIFATLAEPVRRFGGTIDDYVGDMAMVTWPMAAGVAQGRCIACVFAFLSAVEADAAGWQRRFGQVPRFRAALHGGRIVTAEVGIDRHKIAYFGDVVNATGRMEALCRTLDASLLISADLLGRIGSLSPGIVARPLGAHGLKGRGQMLTVLALEPAGATRTGPVAA